MTSEQQRGPFPAQPKPGEALWGILIELGALAAVDRVKAAVQHRKGATLRPGSETPLWNAVVARIRPQLKARGAQAGLARVLGVPRQRVHDYFVSGTQMPDAERMIHVLLWLAACEPEGAADKSPRPPG